MNQRMQAVLFDLDGTLVDSEGLWQESDRRFLDRLGLSVPAEAWPRFVGMGGRAMAAWALKEAGLSRDLEETARAKDDLYLETARGRLTAFPEMVKFARALRLQQVPLAVASGSSRRVIEASLKETGLNGLFTVILSADEVARGKPAPDLFLETARRLGVSPEGCLVLEDSAYGVEAALAAGMFCVAVPEGISAERKPLFDRAHLVYPEGLRQFKAETVLDWIDGTFCPCEDCTFYQFGKCHD